MGVLVVPMEKFSKIKSSHRRCSVKNDVLKNFAKFTGKHMCQCLFFDNVAVLRPATFLKMRLRRRCFAMNFAKFLRTPVFREHLWMLLLKDAGLEIQYFMVTRETAIRVVLQK